MADAPNIQQTNAAGQVVITAQAAAIVALGALGLGLIGGYVIKSALAAKKSGARELDVGEAGEEETPPQLPPRAKRSHKKP